MNAAVNDIFSRKILKWVVFDVEMMAEDERFAGDSPWLSLPYAEPELAGVRFKRYTFGDMKRSD